MVPVRPDPGMSIGDGAFQTRSPLRASENHHNRAVIRLPTSLLLASRRDDCLGSAPVLLLVRQWRPKQFGEVHTLGESSRTARQIRHRGSLRVGRGRSVCCDVCGADRGAHTGI